MGLVDFVQHIWSQQGRDTGTGRRENDTICNNEVLRKKFRMLEAEGVGVLLVHDQPCMEDVMLQKFHV